MLAIVVFSAYIGVYCTFENFLLEYFILSNAKAECSFRVYLGITECLKDHQTPSIANS